MRVASGGHHDQTDLLDERDDDMKGAWGEVDAALQALRDLGVDVDASLGEPLPPGACGRTMA